jgi:diketogulonate reductase-like aldo/keto reductase
VALNWVLRQEKLVIIPKAVNKEHISDNLHALILNLEKDNLEQIELTFPIVKTSLSNEKR